MWSSTETASADPGVYRAMRRAAMRFPPRRPSRRDALKLAFGAVAAACSRSAGVAPDAAASSRSQVLVLGGGISGLAAARRLSERGFADVRILEARDRLGGRIHTDRSTGMPFDMGAAWVHYAGDPTNPLLDLVDGVGLAPKPTNWNKLHAYDEVTGLIGPSVLGAAETSFEAALVQGAKDVGALADPHVPLEPVLLPLFAQRFSGDAQQRLLRLMRGYYLENEYAADLDELGAYELVAYEADNRKEDDRLVGGYDVLIESLAQGLDVRLGEVVTRVRLDADGVTVDTSRGSYTADAVIVTLPVGVLRSGAIEFDPALPDAKSQAIQQIGVGDFEKVVMIFDQPFWPQTPHAFGFAASSSGGSPLLLNLQAVAGMPALVAMLTGSAGRAASAASDRDLTAQMIGQLRTMFGAAAPAPRTVLRTRWHDDPYALGAYSYPGVGDLSSAIAELAAPIAGRIHFAGEATHAPWYSFAHGAYLSGIRAANEV